MKWFLCVAAALMLVQPRTWADQSPRLTARLIGKGADFPVYRRADIFDPIYQFTFKNPFPHPLYYLVERGYPAYVKNREETLMLGGWGNTTGCEAYVAWEWRRLAPNQTLQYEMPHPRQFRPWRSAVVFYPTRGIQGEALIVRSAALWKP